MPTLLVGANACFWPLLPLDAANPRQVKSTAQEGKAKVFSQESENFRGFRDFCLLFMGKNKRKRRYTRYINSPHTEYECN